MPPRRWGAEFVLSGPVHSRRRAHAGRDRARGQTDGEFRRGSYWAVSSSAPRGWGARSAIASRRPATRSFHRALCHGAAAAQALADELLFLLLATVVTAKVTLPAPSMHFLRFSTSPTVPPMPRSLLRRSGRRVRAGDRRPRARRLPLPADRRDRHCAAAIPPSVTGSRAPVAAIDAGRLPSISSTGGRGLSV